MTAPRRVVDDGIGVIDHVCSLLNQKVSHTAVLAVGGPS